MKCVWHLPRRRVSIQSSLNPVHMLCISFHFICVFSFFTLFTLCIFLLPSHLQTAVMLRRMVKLFVADMNLRMLCSLLRGAIIPFLWRKCVRTWKKPRYDNVQPEKTLWIIDTFGCKMNGMNFWSMSKGFFCLRLMQPMRTRRRCWKSISVVSPMAQWKPTKKGPVIGSKTKDLLWRGVWPIFNRHVTFYTMLTEQTLSLRVDLKLTKPDKSNSQCSL